MLIKSIPMIALGTLLYMPVNVSAMTDDSTTEQMTAPAARQLTPEQVNQKIDYVLDWCKKFRESTDSESDQMSQQGVFDAVYELARVGNHNGILWARMLTPYNEGGYIIPGHQRLPRFEDLINPTHLENPLAIRHKQERPPTSGQPSPDAFYHFLLDEQGKIAAVDAFWDRYLGKEYCGQELTLSDGVWNVLRTRVIDESVLSYQYVPEGMIQQDHIDNVRQIIRRLFN